MTSDINNPLVSHCVFVHNGPNMGWSQLL